MKHYGIWVIKRPGWFSARDEIFWTTSRAVARLQMEFIVGVLAWFHADELEVREFPES